MGASEAEVAGKLLEAFRLCGRVKKATSGKCVRSKAFRDALEWYGLKTPWLAAEPDLILVFEDYRRVVDDAMLVAVELKYFRADKRLHNKLREAFRGIGQPLRYLAFGFDSALLWHVFDREVGEDIIIKPYTKSVKDVIEKLRLPLAYIATSVFNGKFKLFQPWHIEECDVDYVASSIRGLCDSKRNPAIERQDVTRMRSALKISLGIPS